MSFYEKGKGKGSVAVLLLKFTYVFLFLTTFRLGKNTFLLVAVAPPLPPNVKSLAGVSEDSLGMPFDIKVVAEFSRFTVDVVLFLVSVEFPPAAVELAFAALVEAGIFTLLEDIYLFKLFSCLIIQILCILCVSKTLSLIC